MPTSKKSDRKGANGSQQNVNLQNSKQPQPPIDAMQDSRGYQIYTDTTQELLSQSREILYGENVYTSNNPNMSDSGNGNVYTNQHYQTNMQDSGRLNLCNTGVYPSTQPIHTQASRLNGTQCGVPIDQSAYSGIPPWATALCNQMNTLQSVIEQQNSKWHNMASNINSQNDRLAAIEIQISELSTLKSTVTHANEQVNKIHSEVRILKTKVSDFDSSVQGYSDICDDITSHNSGVEMRLNNVEKKMAMIEKQQTTLEGIQKRTDERCIDTQWRTMRENLIFSGIPEVAQDEYKKHGEDCEATLVEIITKDMLIDREIFFDRVHRLGKFNRNHQYPRPIVAKFTYYKDREYIRKLAPTTLEGTNVYVNEQFPPEMENERKLLYRPAREARENRANTVRLVKDKLFINGHRYIPQGRTSQERSEMQPMHSTQPQWQSSTTVPDANRRIEPANRWSRTFTRSRKAQGRILEESALPTHNAFAILDPDRENDTDLLEHGVQAGKALAPSELVDADIVNNNSQYVEVDDEITFTRSSQQPESRPVSVNNITGSVVEKDTNSTSPSKSNGQDQHHDESQDERNNDVPHVDI